MKEVITMADENRFSDFTKKVKSSLEDKLRDNPTIRAKGEELQKLQAMRKNFSKVTDVEVEQETPQKEIPQDNEE